MDFRKAKFILPNLFTLSSVMAGLFSIHLSTTGSTVSEMTLAAWLLVVAMVCDGFDGRVARLTRTESQLGIQLDSLADAISFGVAPAFLLYHWGLKEWGALGLLWAGAYVCSAVLRLARFNVMASESGETKRYFIGLPTPLAAGTVVSVVLAHVAYTSTISTGATWSVAAIALVLGGLMVSNVRYRTFKDLNLRGAAVARAVGVVAAIATISVILEPSITFVMLFFAYIVIGLLGGVVSLGKHLLGHDLSLQADEERGEDGILAPERSE